ncbi:hypothetical protein [Parerythrobacter lacustris]|uniref:Surface antigen domain-containing protein n=1 Tax=Parerythrobacter lacustris TaxID=2969984 RepID=A0ABT1XNZ4_9SPHN|nr:hypothetical protein [Parerythrobacter lacustris]MCR2833379.1 hypothetical protein [Parerythrobacter lacustris]
MTQMFRSSAARATAMVALAGLVAGPAHAQFGGLIPREVQSVTNDAADTDACGNEKKSSAGGRVLGGILGRTARNAVGSTGIGSFVPLPDFEDQISKEIACKLDPEEQKQAAEATLAATRSVAIEGEDTGEDTRPQVGSSSSWKSNTREGVSGTSTVTARETPEDSDLDCIVVTDVVVVKGEDTKIDKRMCRPPGSRRYSIVA